MNTLVYPHALKFVAAVTRALDTLASAAREQGRYPAGYFTVRSRRDNTLALLMPFGDGVAEHTNPEKYVGWRDKALEKGDRLFNNPGHVSSWQSRDPEKKKYGGAIAVGDYILTFSGLPEALDEALCALVALDMGIADAQTVQKIFEVSGNAEGQRFLAQIK
ncbi:MAG TPA: hypothetical protein VGE35_03060 [Candidatus Paceibacterota bacterium]